MDSFKIVENGPLSDDELNGLFLASWPGHIPRAFTAALSRSLVYFGGYLGTQLIGFVNVAWDGGQHAFLLDPTVHPDFRRRGLGRALVDAAIHTATARGIEWLHVDYESSLESFYRSAGFRPTHAGLLKLAS
jgi:ribosomal protein S18 acetylase RimI-like enzyme